ncbi:MAG: hypothetical protein IJR83_01205 [Clostridia bacterium]|nr:hypothetical protein [Clostridia bacterium]
MKTYNFKKNANGEITVRSQRRDRKIHIVPIIVCLLIAVLVWLYVAGNDPGTARDFTVGIGVRGEEKFMDDAGMKVYLPGDLSVTATIRGREDFVGKLKEEQVLAFVDVSETTMSGIVTLPVHVELEKGVNPSLDVSDISIQECRVLIDSESVKRIPVVARSADGSVLYSSRPEEIVLTGPATVLASIDRAECTIYGSHKPGETISSQKYVFVDITGAIVTSEFLDAVKADATTVRLTAYSPEEDEPGVE